MLKKLFLLLAVVSVLISACAAPAPTAVPVTQALVMPATATAKPAPTATATEIPPSPTPVVVLSPTPDVTLFPIVTLAKNATCRMGPDANYFKVVSFAAGQSTQVHSRNEDAKWLLVNSNTVNKNPTCWVPVESMTAFEGLDNLVVSNPPPLPTGPTRATGTAGACGVNRKGAVVVSWSPTVSGTGYYVLRNGKNIATIYGDTYIDHDTPGSKLPYVLTYVIQGFDSVGMSKVVASVSVTICK